MFLGITTQIKLRRPSEIFAALRETSRYLDGRPFRFFLVFLLFLAFYALTSGEKTHFDEHVRLADALLHGHAWIEPPPSYMERANYAGHSYIVHPPLPALILVPLVAIFGPSLNQTWVPWRPGHFRSRWFGDYAV